MSDGPTDLSALSFEAALAELERIPSDENLGERILDHSLNAADLGRFAPADDARIGGDLDEQPVPRVGQNARNALFQLRLM